jgi:hypothetical protein
VTFIVDIGRDGSKGPLWNWRPGRFRSRVVTRWWWGSVAVAKLNISHEEYARTEFNWTGGTP